MSDILDHIDATLSAVTECACGCGQQVDPNGPSAWFATEFCQNRWYAQHAAQRSPDTSGVPSPLDVQRRINTALQAQEQASRAAVWLSGGRVFLAPVGTDPDDRDAWREVGTISNVRIESDELAPAQPSDHTPGGVVAALDIDHDRMREVGQMVAEVMAAYRHALEAAFASLTAALRPAMRIAEQLGQEQPPTDPRERALWLRRNRNTGPRATPRAPKRIEPRRFQ